MYTNKNPHSFPVNHSTGNQPCSAPSHRFTGHGACQPPKNMVVANAETVTMLTYSASMNMANANEEYSVWNPPTNSPSASGRSKGARLVSPTIAVRYTMNDGSRMIPNQNCSCAATMPEVDMVPANRNTATNDSPMASSHESTCAGDRS